MSFRVLLATLLTVALALGFTFVVLSMTILRSQVAAILPAALAFETDGALQTLLMGQAVAVFIFGGIVLGTFVWIIGNMVGKPLRVLSEAMGKAATTEEAVAVPDVSSAPAEIQSLAASFDAFMYHAEESHKHDTEISRVKSDFISTAAHQLRTPLTGVRWALEALQKENLSENQKLLVQSAVDKSKDLVAVVGTLLDISAIESGKYKYTFVSLDMGELLAQLANDFGPLAAKGQVSLFYAKDEEKPVPSVKADKERVKWVLNNLIENAIRYTPTGGTVRISTDAAEHRVFVRVKDTGIGILPEDRGNIFERFYRGSNAIAKENQGNGLGLYIARTIATDHGGDLHFVPNEDGPGTTFVFSLPTA